MSSPQRLLLAVLVAVIATLAAASPAMSAVTIGMPFTGKWAYNTHVNPPYSDSNSSHPGFHWAPGGGDWSTDLYAQAGTQVRLRASGTGAVTFSWAGSTGCGGSTRLNVFENGVQVGTLYIAHLAGAVTSGPISNGMVLGTVANLSCNPGPHIHVEFKNTGSGRSCYIDHGYPGTSVGDGVPLGVLGSSSGGACVSTPPPPPLALARPGDYNGDGFTNRAVYRPSGGSWHISGVGDYTHGQPGDIPVPGDYNGDGTTDVAVYRPANGAWYIRGVGDFAYGQPGDIPVPGYWNATQPRVTQMAVYRPSTGTWHLRTVGDKPRYGQSGDIPLPGDYNGPDGYADRAVYRPSDQTWHIEGVGDFKYGEPGDTPVPADYNGDRKLDVAVYRPNTGWWYVRGIGDFKYGEPGDIPVPGAYAGNDFHQAAVYRPSTGTWHIRGIGDFPRYGEPGDIPVVGTTNIMLLRQFQLLP